MISPAKKLIALATLVAALAAPAAAQAGFGLVPDTTTVTALNKDGTIAEQASSHPASFTVHFELNADSSGKLEGGEVRDVLVDTPVGLIGNPGAMSSCPRQGFEGPSPNCPVESQVGTLDATVPGLGHIFAPIYNVSPPPGVPTMFGFSLGGHNVFQYASVRSEAGYGLRVSSIDVPIELQEATERIWGVPADPANDAGRFCRKEGVNGLLPGCTTTAPLLPYLTLPADCGAPMRTGVQVDSKLDPGNFLGETVESLDAGGNPASLQGCDAVPFDPEIASQATSRLASSPSGLEFELKLPNQGLESPGGTAETEPRKVVVTLPEGMGINPSLAEGVSTCSAGQYAAEQLESAAGAGCPEGSKLGSVVVHTPLLEEPAEGSLYLAAPYANPFGTLAALYMVARAPERGILVKQAGKVEFDQATGQITTTFEGLPPIPFSSFKLHFREGARAPLATPQACGEYKTVAKLTPFSAASDAGAIERTASFQIERGPEGGACPVGGLPPFHPGLTAGTLNNAAGAFSPFNVRLTRTDAEQEITHFSIKLPPGIAGKLAGIPFCPDAAIAAATARTGPHGGAEELASPSCPVASYVGRTFAGAGVGSALAYAPGKVYLAGPYHGSPVSIVAITAGVVGPFDIGTVVVRLALQVNPETGEVFLDSTGSDAIPHIVKGIPVHLRDIRAYTDRPEFTFNPTSCEPSSTSSTVLGSGLDFASPADDNPVVVSTRFQAADCAALPFKPKLTLKLTGQTKRTGNPALKAHLAMKGFGEAGLAYAQVALPKTLFLDNRHINTICTRVQFKQGAVEGEKCPAGSIIGSAKATTPILDEPLEGPIYLRSSEHQLPDIAAALQGQEIHVVAVGHTDSAPGGGLRNTFEVIPDAPIGSVDISLFGGKRGLIQASRGLCSYKPKATVRFRGHNGKQADSTVPLKASGCGKKSGKHKRHARRP